VPILPPTSAGRFVKAVIGLTAPANSAAFVEIQEEEHNGHQQ
jgi:hypothetical protein